MQRTTVLTTSLEYSTLELCNRALSHTKPLSMRLTTWITMILLGLRIIIHAGIPLSEDQLSPHLVERWIHWLYWGTNYGYPLVLLRTIAAFISQRICTKSKTVFFTRDATAQDHRQVLVSHSQTFHPCSEKSSGNEIVVSWGNVVGNCWPCQCSE